MDKIIIGFSRPKGKFKFFSWAIRLAENTDYSHVYLKFYSSRYDRGLIYQASGLEVNFIEERRFNDIEVIVKEFELEVDSVDKDNFIQFAIDNVGAPYGMKQVLGLGLVLLARKFNKNIKNPFGDGSHSFFCSELVKTVLTGPLHKNIDLEPELTLPRDVYEYLESCEKLNG